MRRHEGVDDEDVDLPLLQRRFEGLDLGLQDRDPVAHLDGGAEAALAAGIDEEPVADLGRRYAMVEYRRDEAPLQFMAVFRG